MSSPAALLLRHIALLSLISFGGAPGVLPDLHDFTVAAHGWISDRDFADCFAIVQAVPGPNMVLMMTLVAWKIAGLPAALAAAPAIFAPSCTLAFAAFRWWDRFRDAAWQRRARRGLAPVTIGLVTAGGFAMARAGHAGPMSLLLTAGAIGIVLGTRLSPLWLIAAGGVLGACGVI